MNASGFTAISSLTSPHKLLDYYLQMLHSAKVDQIKMLAAWSDVAYAPPFKAFLAEQQQTMLQQRDSLKALENIFDVFLMGDICRPVEGLLQEANQVAQFPGSDIDLTEPLIIQLIQCIKQYEVTTSRSALTLAYTIGEQEVANILANVAVTDSESFLQLQHLLTTHWENVELPYNSEMKK